jgi:hypothetical protein
MARQRYFKLIAYRPMVERKYVEALVVPVTASMKQQIVAAAAREDRTIAGWARRALQQSLPAETERTRGDAATR